MHLSSRRKKKVFILIVSSTKHSEGVMEFDVFWKLLHKHVWFLCYLYVTLILMWHFMRLDMQVTRACWSLWLSWMSLDLYQCWNIFQELHISQIFNYISGNWESGGRQKVFCTWNAKWKIISLCGYGLKLAFLNIQLLPIPVTFV